MGYNSVTMVPDFANLFSLCPALIQTRLTLYLAADMLATKNCILCTGINLKQYHVTSRIRSH